MWPLIEPRCLIKAHQEYLVVLILSPPSNVPTALASSVIKHTVDTLNSATRKQNNRPLNKE